MKVRSLSIVKWRNFKDIHIEVPSTARFVCLVGENGTGKSSILELIHQLLGHSGFAPLASESRRGGIFELPDEFQIEFEVNAAVVTAMKEFLPENFSLDGWDRLVRIGRKSVTMPIGVRLPAREAPLTMEGTGWSSGRDSFHLQGIWSRLPLPFQLFLDSDRSFPQLQLGEHAYAEAMRTEWTPALSRWRRESGAMRTADLYQEWIRYCFGVATRAAIAHSEAEGLAQRDGRMRPEYVDPFCKYRQQLASVLPHLKYVGLDMDNRVMRFDTGAGPVPFHHLSGGEKEIAFLVGQVERFGLRDGLLLIDEPELHLNAALVRKWVRFAQDSVDDGQIWIATHSLEAVEAAGAEGTLVLERENDGSVCKATRLSGKPLCARLAHALGTPAFAVDRVKVVFVEGEDPIVEAGRFERVCASSVETRFLPVSGCREVCRNLRMIANLNEPLPQKLRVGGIIDQDLRSESAIEALKCAAEGLFVLPVHEVENLFLYPLALDAIMAAIGNSQRSAQELLLEASDRRAGRWIGQSASRDGRTDLVDEWDGDGLMIKLMGQYSWQQLDTAATEVCRNVAATAKWRPKDGREAMVVLLQSVGKYRSLRTSDDLWRRCEGKEVLTAIAKPAGFAEADALERAVIKRWSDHESSVPDEVIQLRSYVASL